MITFLCANCGKHLRVPDEVAGKRCRCPSCNTINVVPNSTPTENGAFTNSTPSNSIPQQSRSEELFPSASAGASSSPGGLWDGLETQSNSSLGQAPNPYGAVPTLGTQTPGAFQFGSSAYMPQQQSPGYLPEASPLGMILGILSVCMPLFVCFYGLSIPIGLILGIAAWLTSSNERKKAAQGIVRVGLANVGYTLGIIGTIINAIMLLLIIALIALFIFSHVNGAG